MLKTALIIPDSHIPYHDRRAYNLMINVARSIQLDEICILGDYADFYAINAHGKHPQMLHTLQTEVAQVNEELDKLDFYFPNTKKVFIEGNHEYRFERFISMVCPALFGVTEPKFLFNINQRPNWTFHHYGPNQIHHILGSKLKARHEPLGNNAKLTATRALCSLVYGHIHRIEESHIVGLDGTNHVAFSVGWLGDKRMDKVFGYVKGHHQWQMGFGLVHVDDSTGYFYHQKIHILDNYTCVVNGKLYKG
jgi:hypothetical protein